ncbi:hypothetical protein GPECTOR_16g697 [Gonium pectorale]|uniref:Uncharacterized protein n=1 Tax=Gonium pectorale TaxID=33097 RepID=A0A150GL38_GONPE|nr:hypothetical protein GPECTOR_16g697 [Gonium pectorale]|eukprot:KXZ50522.1 hypothetical protein GPECTOR_16g697 [Gonium pectorale]
MSSKVAPAPALTADRLNKDPGHGASPIAKEQRTSRVFRAVNDVYEFDGWKRVWIKAAWFVATYLVMYCMYPVESGHYISKIMSLMASYEPAPGASSDVRSVQTFGDALSHSLGFLTAHIDKSIAGGFPGETVMVTDYDQVLFARMELDFKTNCEPAFAKIGALCYRSGLDPTTGAQMDPATVASLTGAHGVHQLVLLDRGFTRNQTLEAVAQVLGEHLSFVTSYAKQVASLVMLVMEIWAEVVQFNTCWSWVELHAPDEDRSSNSKSARKRLMHVTWLFFAQGWNLVEALAILNYVAWWIAYIVIIVRSYHAKVRVMETQDDFDAMRSFAQLRFRHLVWGIFSSVLLGSRIVSEFKTHVGLRVYAVTLAKTWDYFKDLLVFFGAVWLLIVVLVTPLFTVTGANASFTEGNTALLNIGLIAFSLFGYQEYFANDSPTFGDFKVVFMLVFWFTIIVLVVISQNVMLALVAAAYDEAREAEGNEDRSFLGLSWYRICWTLYSGWHRWVLRKSRHAMLEGLMASMERPDSWSYKSIFLRWALSSLPETRLLSQLYTDPASENLYLYSPWAWSRASPWDSEHLAPWDEQLSYPMYTWAQIPVNSPGVRPRLRRLPPLLTSKGGQEVQSRLPVHYNDADDIFAMAEDEVDELLDCVEAAWERMRRNAVVGRFSTLGWSERGRALLREGLLEVYRRHGTHERTTSTIQSPALQGSGCGQAKQEAQSGGSDPGVLHVKSTAALVQLPSPRQAGAFADHGPDPDPDGPPINGAPAAAHGPAGHVSGADLSRRQEERGRQLHFFNRRGRIAESLELLWNQQGEIRAQQEDLKAMLHALLLEMCAFYVMFLLMS